MSETTQDRKCCCNLCKCVKDNKHIFSNKVLMNSMHKCSSVDTLTETHCIEMYARIRNEQIDTYNRYMEIDIDFKNKRKETNLKYCRKRMANKQQTEQNANSSCI